MLITLSAAVVLGCQGTPMQSPTTAPAQTDKSVYEFTMRNIDGKDVPLKEYKGKVLLIVNVASKCGLTPQYAKLQELYAAKKDKGFEILAFPANEFNGQEPGTNDEIKQFCSTNYGITFPLFSKIVVKGQGIHPLYDYLVHSTENQKEIEWNFAKFLVGRDGKVVARFHPKTSPDAPEIKEALDKALASAQ